MLKNLLFDAMTIHVCCKDCLRQAIETGASNPPSAVIRSETMCEFGQWLDRPDLASEISTSPHYANMRKIHADFHTAAANVMELVEIGETEKAKQMMSVGGDYTLHSNQLRSEFLNWVADLN
jgi:Chemoreceptor zinc-binding domain